ncbi:hypothetical protein AALA22_05915 [Anaerovoracaceae bacterium 41-7]
MEKLLANKKICYICIILGVAVLLSSVFMKTLEEHHSYRPMLCYNNKLYGETNNLQQFLPDDFIEVGRIKRKISNMMPMEHTNFVSNNLNVGTRVFSSSNNLKSIYVKLSNQKYIEYMLICD